jgi:hypothetical protein
MSQKGKYLSVPPTTFGGIVSIPQTNPNFGKTFKFMDPISLIALIGSAVASIAGAVGSNASINKQLKEQKNENASTRQYNLMLARLQNKWNFEQWQRENDYNSPTAQMARFRSAGLNPNLIYGQQNMSASSPTLTSGASASPQDMSPIGRKRNFGQAVQEMLNLEMQQAQIEAIKAGTENTKANTVKTGEETKSLTIDNMYKAAREQLNLEYQGVQISVGRSVENLNQKQAEQVVQNTKNLADVLENNKVQRSLWRRQIQEMDDKAYFQMLDSIRQDAKLKQDIQESWQRIRESQSRIKLTETQWKQAQAEYEDYVYTSTYRYLGLAADARIKQAQVKLVEEDAFQAGLASEKARIDMADFESDRSVFRFFRDRNVPILSEVEFCLFSGFPHLFEQYTPQIFGK